MLIAHLPSGYLVGAGFRRLWPAASGVMPAALVSSVLPDIDMLYFHLVDSRAHHHAFFTHWPLFWLTSGLMALVLARLMAPKWSPAAAAFLTAVMLHMALDTIAAPLWWLAPFSNAELELVRVPAAYSHWIISFALHWTFLLEIAICLAALALWISRPAARTQPPPASRPR